MAQTFQMKQGDTRPPLVITLYDDETHTTPTDLTNATSARVIVGTGSTAPILARTLVFNAARTTGKVSYTWVTGDTDFAVGSYSMEVEVTWSDGKVSTFPKVGYLTFELLPDLDVA